MDTAYLVPNISRSRVHKKANKPAQNQSFSSREFQSERLPRALEGYGSEGKGILGHTITALVPHAEAAIYKYECRHVLLKGDPSQRAELHTIPDMTNHVQDVGAAGTFRSAALITNSAA